MPLVSPLMPVRIKYQMKLIIEMLFVIYKGHLKKIPFNALSLLVRQQEAYPAVQSWVLVWFVGGNDLTGALHVCL